MVRFLPPVLLGVYSVVTLALGEPWASILALALATVLLLSGNHQHSLGKLEELDKAFASNAAKWQETQMSIAIIKQQLASQQSLSSEMMTRLGTLANDLSKVQRSDDPWSAQ
jgi:hypothetical protein